MIWRILLIGACIAALVVYGLLAMLECVAVFSATVLILSAWHRGYYRSNR